MYNYELDVCLVCGAPLKVAYSSQPKTVQTMVGVFSAVHRPMQCSDPGCVQQGVIYKSARWQQLAPCHCTYGYDVIAQIGWERQTGCQTFQVIQEYLHPRIQISESEVRHLYRERYLPLLACHERSAERRAELVAVAQRTGLILSLDGLAPEGGEPQLWVVRELQTGLTLRSGWLSQQDKETFVHFLQPIADLGLYVSAIVSDKQRGLVPAVSEVFPKARYGFCQMHYLKNAAEPLAAADQVMKIKLRQQVRAEIGPIIRQEKGEKTGVMTVTGFLPSPVNDEPAENKDAETAFAACDTITKEREAIVQDLKRRIRYLLTLKGRPPFRLAGIEMTERLAEVESCLATLIAHDPDPQLVTLQHGLRTARQKTQAEYDDLQCAADWLQKVADILDPEGKPARSGDEVRQQLFQYLDDIKAKSELSPQRQEFYRTIRQTTLNYESGLFTCYDVPGLPRTNNDRESEFRDLTRRLLRTTGQKGLVRRQLQKQGAWELIPRPDSLSATIAALQQVAMDDFYQERQRVREHRDRFRMHTRSAKQSHKQMEHLAQRWLALPPQRGP